VKEALTAEEKEGAARQKADRDVEAANQELREAQRRAARASGFPPHTMRMFGEAGPALTLPGAPPSPHHSSPRDARDWLARFPAWRRVEQRQRGGAALLCCCCMRRVARSELCCALWQRETHAPRAAAG